VITLDGLLHEVPCESAVLISLDELPSTAFQFGKKGKKSDPTKKVWMPFAWTS
jgi:hypothetical protein